MHSIDIWIDISISNRPIIISLLENLTNRQICKISSLYIELRDSCSFCFMTCVVTFLFYSSSDESLVCVHCMNERYVALLYYFYKYMTNPFFQITYLNFQMFDFCFNDSLIRCIIESMSDSVSSLL